MAKFGEEYTIKKITLPNANLKYFQNFSCGNESIDNYFKFRAPIDNTAVTYLYIDDDSDKLIACMTIACSAIFTPMIGEDGEQVFSTILSAMEIKYFALDEAYQHIPYYREDPTTKLSDVIFDDMIDHMYRISYQDIGAAKLVLYSVDTAVSFYKRHGFKTFDDAMYGDQGFHVYRCVPMYFDFN